MWNSRTLLILQASSIPVYLPPALFSHIATPNGSTTAPPPNLRNSLGLPPLPDPPHCPSGRNRTVTWSGTPPAGRSPILAAPRLEAPLPSHRRGGWDPPRAEEPPSPRLGGRRKSHMGGRQDETGGGWTTGQGGDLWKADEG